MAKPVKLIDSYFFWCLRKGQALDSLISSVNPANKNFNVIGVIGMQETGKSFLLSQLIKTDFDTENLTFNVSDGSKGRFKTAGVDCFISRDQRTIFLDAQAVYSGSILEEMIVGDRKPPAISTEHVFVEHTAELQSVMFSAFLLSVCHKVLVVSRGCFDQRLLRFIRLATILKLGPVHRESLTESNLSDHWPELMFVNNMGSREDLFPERMSLAKKRIAALMKDYPFGKIESSRYQFISGQNLSVNDELNCFVIPDLEVAKGDESLEVQFRQQMQLLRDRACGTLPADSVTPGNPMTEKDWFRFAKRCWSAVCKAPLVNTVAKELNVSNSV